ncbi:MAG: type III-A CRISPR-associated RAMP protein Csm5 [Pseudomonadota bacterium]
MQIFKVRCEVLSPVHIGAGYDIDPMSYIIKSGKLYRIALDNVVAAMDDEVRAAFETLIDKGNLIEIRKFIANKVNADQDAVSSTEVSPEIEDLYRSKLGDIQNQLLIFPFIRTEGDKVPLIPGSSVKGAIRTAVISEMAKSSKLPHPSENREIYEFESKVMRYKDGKDDPFRGLRIRDKSMQDGDMIIRDVKNASKKRGGQLQTNEIQIICEMTHSMVTGKPLSFETEISFDDNLFATSFLNKKLTIEQIITDCNAFYRDKMVQEHKNFYKGSNVEEVSNLLLNIPSDSKSFIIRLGRFSGVECVTLDNYRNPRPPGGKKVWGTSRNLAEGLYPMGWVRVVVS